MSGGRTRKSMTNIAVNAASQMLTLVLSLMTRTVFLQVFGVEYLGMNGLFTDLLRMLSLVDLGLGTAMVYSFYKPLAENDFSKMAALTDFYRSVYHKIAAAVAVTGVLLIPFLRLILNVEEDIPHLTLYYLFSLADVVVSYLCVYRTSILTADQKNYVVTGIRMAGNVLRAFIQLAVMLALHNYAVYLAVTVVCSVISNLAASRAAVRKYPFIRERAVLGREERKEIFTNVRSVLVYKISATLLNATDNILISLLVSTAAVGLYSNYVMIQNRISGLFSLFFTSLTASVGNLIVREKAWKRHQIFQYEQMVSFLICGVVVPCYGVLVDDLICLWLGEAYMLPPLTAYAAALNLYLSCVLQPLWSYREAAGLYRKTKWVMLICAALNLILSLILGRYGGVTGILVASVLARLFTYIWYEPRVLFREYFDRNEKEYFLQIGKNMVLVTGLAAGIALAGQRFLVHSWGAWMGKAVCAAGVCLAVTAIFYARQLRQIGFELSGWIRKLKKNV